MLFSPIQANDIFQQIYGDIMRQFRRTELILGKDSMEKLKNSRVAVFGIGGVGGHVVESLVRSGIGAIDLIDNDVVHNSNINRQVIALLSNVGNNKVDEFEKRIKDINSEVVINTHKCFFTPENSHLFNFSDYDYIADCIDTVTGKIELVMKAQEAGVPIISSMGTGNKMNPAELEVSDIYKTSVCPLAKVMRQELKKRRVKKLKVVYSKEIPITPKEFLEDPESKKRIIGSNAFVPAAAGIIIASEIVKDIIKKER